MLDALHTEGSTNLWDGLDKALQTLQEVAKNQNANADRQSAVMLLTDGQVCFLYVLHQTHTTNTHAHPKTRARHLSNGANVLIGTAHERAQTQPSFRICFAINVDFLCFAAERKSAARRGGDAEALQGHARAALQRGDVWVWLRHQQVQRAKTIR